MRKAFDANVPKLKPRLKSAVVVVSKSGPETDDESVRLFEVVPSPRSAALTPVNEPKPDQESAPEPASTENHSPSPVADEIPDPETGSGSKEVPTKQVAAAKGEPPAAAPASPAAPVDCARDSAARRERLEKVKRKVADAVRTGIRIEPVPEDPAQAAESVLGLVSDLETQLSRTRDLEKALRTDLEQAKTELTRVVTEGRTAAERLGQAEAQLGDKGKVLEEMLIEMGALEEERDQAVRRVQTLTALDEQHRKQLDDLGRRSADMEKALTESKAEEERLSSELDERMTENAQLRSVLSEVTQERDGLARNAERLTKERDELVEAKKALEKVHQALAQARARLGR
jgi:septal ring factor EnvC (AmiA/AmiB activator)